MDVSVLKTGAKFSLPLAILFVFIFTACASQPVHMPQHLESADTSVSRAKMENAEDYSPKDFKLAEDKLAEAKDRHILEERKVSLLLAQQADIDARVAAAKAESVQLFGEIRGLRNDIDQLRDEIDQFQ